MELAIAIAVVSAATGCIAGMVIVGRHFELECEQAYLTGHVDGYRKAEEDLDYHREADRNYGGNDD